jgi:hypothetical protein
MLRSIFSSLPYRSLFLRFIILISIVIIAILGVISLPSISQNHIFYHFADRRSIFTIPNASNVLSNVFFCISGILGFRRFGHLPSSPTVLRWQLFFISTTLVGLGSAYYHWFPSNDSLFWDRLPMALGFAFMTAGLFAERLGEHTGQALLGPFVFLSTTSIVYCWFTEQLGLGDIRPYILTQYLPLLLTPALLILFPKGPRWDRPYWILFIGLTIAKGFEWKDFAFYEWTYHLISGHTLKHIITAIAILLFHPHCEDLISLKDITPEQE